MIALGTAGNPAMPVRVFRARQISLRHSSKVLRMLQLRGDQVPQKGSSQAIKAAVVLLLSSLFEVGLRPQIQIRMGL